MCLRQVEMLCMDLVEMLCMDLVEMKPAGPLSEAGVTTMVSQKLVGVTPTAGVSLGPFVPPGNIFD